MLPELNMTHTILMNAAAAQDATVDIWAKNAVLMLHTSSMKTCFSSVGGWSPCVEFFTFVKLKNGHVD